MSVRRRSLLGLEIVARPERVFNLSDGAAADGVRVRYRAAGVRRWTTFLLWPDEGQSVAELLERAADAADRVYSGRVVELRDDDFGPGSSEQRREPSA